MNNNELQYFKQRKLPKISIGIPVYNGEKTIRAALNSVLAQTFSDFEVTISDNASTDQTAEICKEYAELDSRIKYLRQQPNIGAFRNFDLLAKKAKTPYFVWLAADDYWESTFLAENIAALDDDPSAVASISRVAFISSNTGLFSRKTQGTYALQNATFKNLWKYLSKPSDNSRFYSVFRTEVIQKSLMGMRPCHGADLLIMAITLLYGNHIEIPNLLMYRSDFEIDRYVKQVAHYNNNLLTKLFPVLPMSWLLIKNIGVIYSLLLFLPIVRLNINKHIEYVKLHHGVDGYFKFLGSSRK